MEIPLGIKIFVLAICGAIVFSLAARELVFQWLSSFLRFLLRSASAIPKQIEKGFAQNGMHILKQKAR